MVASKTFETVMLKVFSAILENTNLQNMLIGIKNATVAKFKTKSSSLYANFNSLIVS